MTWNRIAAALALAAGLLASLPVAAEDLAPIDAELDKYWNVEQAVPALKNPLYERAGGLEFSVHGGIVPNDSFYVPKPVGARLAYFFTDTLSAEVGGSYLLSSLSDLEAFLECATVSNGRCADLTVRKPPKMTMLTSLDIAYTPFHGKVGIFTSKLSSFDMGLSLGGGLIGVDIDEGNDGVPDIQSTFKPAGHWGANFRFFVTRWLNVRADYKQFIYWPVEGSPFLAPVEFTLGLAFLTK
jgi:outer membrane beta-barrel protein